jgi:hypothetical protein
MGRQRRYCSRMRTARAHLDPGAIWRDYDNSGARAWSSMLRALPLRFGGVIEPAEHQRFDVEITRIGSSRVAPPARWRRARSAMGCVEHFCIAEAYYDMLVAQQPRC